MRFVVARLTQAVALHPEGVDRNKDFAFCTIRGIAVALHPEGVDRNRKARNARQHAQVALHPEGVDRNLRTKLKA